MSTFDRSRASAVRDYALDAVDKAASEVWREGAWKAILFIAERRPEFTTDAVWYRMEQEGVTAPREPRAMGPMMLRAVTQGVCEGTGRVSRSVRVECHRRPVAIYRSLRYAGHGR